MERKWRIENAAELGAFLINRGAANRAGQLVTELQRAARVFHKNAERNCNEDLGCPHCKGDGCDKCANTGLTTGPREVRMMKKIRALVAPYGLRVYEQGDPRGWPLYLIPEESGPEREDDSTYNTRGMAVCPH